MAKEFTQDHSNYFKLWRQENNTSEEVNKKPARMRTIEETFKFIREADPSTSLTKTSIRRLILKKEIPSIKIGNKYLVNLDTLCDYLNNPPSKSEKTFTQNGIRPISEKIYK